MKNKTNVKTVQTGHVETGHALSVPQQKLIPKLRFPEFVNSGEWEVKRVNEYFDVCSSKRVLQKDWKNKGVPFYRTRELVSLSKNEAFRSEIYISKNLFYKLSNKYGIPKIGDFLVSGVGTLGVLFQIKNNEEFYFKDGNVLWFKIGREIVSDFFKYSFQTAFFQKQIFSQSSASTVGTYTITNARETKFWKPSDKNEQQKIAFCLSSLDEVIEAHSKKLQLLKDHKKGLMQNLFPQKGEKVPKLRFPEFQNCGEWEETILEKISPAIFDGTHQTPKYTQKGIPFFSVENLVSGNKNKFISREDYLLATSKNKPEKEDVLITRIGNIGFSTVVDWDYEFSIYVTLAVVKKSNRFISHYLNGYFQSDIYQKEIRSKSLLNATPMKINMNELRKTKVFLPILDEQQKIASCLSALDNLITAQTEKIEQLQEHKKGLMQGLFPVQTGHALSQQ